MTPLLLAHFANELTKIAAIAEESPHFAQRLEARESNRANISPVGGTAAVAGGTVLSNLAGKKATDAVTNLALNRAGNALSRQYDETLGPGGAADKLYEELFAIKRERERINAKGATHADLEILRKGQEREADIQQEIKFLVRTHPEMVNLDKIRAAQAPDVVMSRTGRDIVENMGLKKYVRDEKQLEQLAKKLESRGPFYAGFMGKRQIYLSPDWAAPALYAHELGHATGNRILSRGFIPHLMTGARMGGFATSALGGTLGTYRALKKQTDEEQDAGLKKARNIALLGGLGHLPLLTEEARASIRAVNMGRQVGKGTEYAKQLLPAFGSYATRPLAITGGTALGVEALRRYRKKKNAKIDERK